MNVLQRKRRCCTGFFVKFRDAVQRFLSWVENPQNPPSSHRQETQSNVLQRKFKYLRNKRNIGNSDAPLLKKVAMSCSEETGERRAHSHHRAAVKMLCKLTPGDAPGRARAGGSGVHKRSGVRGSCHTGCVNGLQSL